MNSEIFTFKYPGRELKCLDGFLIQKPEVLDHYIYDINLTSGQLLYRCKGGIGATREPYIIKMHQWIQTSTLNQSLDSVLEEKFGGKVGKWRYLRLREKFNESDKKLQNWTNCSELYWLWACSSFTQRYRNKGYDGTFYPTVVDKDGLLCASRTSREKNLLFREEDLFSFKESVVNENVIVYAHLPKNFGVYGAGWVWNRKKLETFCRVVSELDKKLLISAPFEIRGRVDLDYREHFPNLNYLIIPEFKESRYSEIYLFNF